MFEVRIYSRTHQTITVHDATLPAALTFDCQTNFMKRLLAFLPALLLVITTICQPAKPFLWGTSSAAYQVEGAYQTDGKGESKWDFLTNKVGITQFIIGEKQTGNVAINMYDRNQYLKDIQLLKELGVNAYRFTLDWSRIIPDGIGAPNEKALAHYDQLIDDILAAGLEPVVTLVHFDFPFVLLQKGGWSNPQMVDWYVNYAKICFERYGKKVKKFITFNEPYIDFFLADFLENNEQSKAPANVRMASGMLKAHHNLLASAKAIQLYRAMKLGGSIGITLNLAPCVPANPANPKDVTASAFQDLFMNRLFLDAVFKGSYPKQVIDTMQKYDKTFKITAAEMELLASVKPDFLGVNYYALAMVKYDEASAFNTNWMDTNPDSVKSGSGPVRPQQLYALLMRIKRDYNNPQMMITENGASFEKEDVKTGNAVNDTHRAGYITKHVSAALKAKKDGANLTGYFVWSGWDNFEWVFGFTRRYGIIYVDFSTQERTPKLSYYTYRDIIQRYK